MNKLYEKIFKILIEYNIYQLPTAFQIEGLNKILAICEEQPKQITIEEAIERVLELNDKNRYVSLQNVNGQRAGYIQALKDFNLLKQ